MKRMTTLVFVLGGFVLWGETLPTNEEINQIYATAENYEQIRGQLYDTLTSMDHSASSFPSSELVRVQYCIMTNTFERSLATNRDISLNFSPKESLFGWISSFDAVEDDINALNYCADYINTIRPLATNDFAVERAQYAAATNMVAFWRKWRQILGYNFYLPTYRRLVIAKFWYATTHYMKTIPEEDIPAFKTNIIMRAGLSQEEAEKLFESVESRYGPPLRPPPEGGNGSPP